jgi:uncharacterized SAM-dependent methyltransferase
VRAHRRALRDLLPAAGSFVLIDLGAGDCGNAAALFDALPRSTCIAADIAVPVLDESLRALQTRHPQLPMIGLGVDFTQRLELPSSSNCNSLARRGCCFLWAHRSATLHPLQRNSSCGMRARWRGRAARSSLAKIC